MKLKFLRMDNVVELEPGATFVLEIQDHAQFAQIAESIFSEKGEEAFEPYLIWDDRERPVRPKKAMILVPDLLNIPLGDRILLGALYKRLSSDIENDNSKNDNLALSALEMRTRLAEAQIEMLGSYSFQADWSIELFLKSFSFGLDVAEDDSLLNRCTAFLGLCADVVPDQPICFCNLKSFLGLQELETLYESIFSLGERVLILESWPDVIKHAHESKLVVDQQFLENSI